MTKELTKDPILAESLNYDEVVKVENILSYPTIIGSTIIGGTANIGEGNSVLKFNSTDGIWLGNTAFASAPFRVTMAGALTATSATISGSITATTGAIGGWNILSGYIYNLQSGTPTSSPSDGIVMASGNEGIIVYENTEKRVELGYLSAGVYGLKVYADDGSTVIFEASDTQKVFDGQYLSGSSVTSSAVKPSLRGSSHDLVFSASDADTVAWASGTITLSDGTSYSITGANTGNMSARTYIYLDVDTSTTELQTSTTFSDAVGDGKILIASAENGTGEATFHVIGGIGGINIDANSIIVSNLSAISADLGTITAGTITIDSSGYVRGGATAYLTGTGFFLGYSTDAYKFSVGNPSGNYISWDGSDLTINGYVQDNSEKFGGDGSDGAFAESSGTTNIDLDSKKVVVKNYTSFSLTGTADITFSNPHSEGTIIVLKSQGNVTITSSASPAIDATSMGGSGGAAATAGTNGTTTVMVFTNKGNPGLTPTAGTGGNAIGYLDAIRKNLGCGAGGGGGGRSDGANGGGGGGGGASVTTNGSNGSNATTTAHNEAANAAGGRGGGALLIECGGAYNASGTLDVSGAAGANGTGASSSAGGGGGGGGGTIVVIYNSLTADTATYTVAGGSGGTGIGSGGNGGAGGNGASVQTLKSSLY